MVLVFGSTGNVYAEGQHVRRSAVSVFEHWQIGSIAVLLKLPTCLEQGIFLRVSCGVPDVLSRETMQDLAMAVQCFISCSLEPLGTAGLPR